MNIWFLENDERLTRERAAIEALEERATWFRGTTWTFSSRANLALQVSIFVGETEYCLLLEYPALFPVSPPSVFPLDKDRRLSGHQFGFGGELCLEWGPDNWDASITGADMLESAHKLISSENPDTGSTLIPVESRHQATLGQDLRGSLFRFALGPELEAALYGLPMGCTGSLQYRTILRKDDCTIFITDLQPHAGDSWKAPELPPTFSLARILSESGSFAKVPLSDETLGTSSVTDLTGALEVVGCSAALSKLAERRDELPLLLLQGATGRIRVCLLRGDGSTLSTVPSFPMILDSSSRSATTREIIEGKLVAIVGLGSAGSKIALSLGRTGIRRFLLIDRDLFLPENIERHTLDWRNIGEHKVDGAKGQLEALGSGMNIEVARLRLSGQEASSSVSYRLAQLANCDLIIDATANPRTFNILSEVARRTGTPMVWLETLAGGIGGIVARFRPQRDPDPSTIRARLNAYLAEQDRAPGQNAGPYAAAEADRVVVANDADVAIIAHHAVRLSLDILSEAEPSSFPNSLYLIGLARGWIFEAPFHTIALDVGGLITPTVDQEESVSQNTLDFVRELLKRHAAAHDSDNPAD